MTQLPPPPPSWPTSGDPARHRAIFDSIVDFAIIVTDRAGLVTEWNAGAVQVLGWTAAEMCGQSTERFFTPEDRDRDRVHTEMTLSLSSGRANNERWHLRKDGGRFWASGEMMPLRDGQGAHLGFVKVLRDRTEEHGDVQALRTAEANLRRAQEAGGVGVFSVGVDDGLLHASPAFCRIFGIDYRPVMPVGEAERLVLPEDAGLASRSATRRSGNTLADVEYRIRRPDTGEIRWIARKGEIERDANGRAVRFAGVVRDITDQVIADRNLADERDQLTQLFEQAPTFMAMLRGPDHRVERVNPGYVRLIGGRDIVGRTIAEGLADAADQGYVAILDEVYRTGVAFVAEGSKYAMQAVEGGPIVDRFVDFVMQPIRDGGGQVCGIFIEGADVTDRRTARDALAESEVRYRTLFEAIDTGFNIVEVVFDADDVAVDYRMIEANAAFEVMTGLVDVQGKWVTDLLPGLERHWFERYGHVALTGEAARFENYTEQLGRWYDVQALRIGEPAARRVAILFNDITARKQVELRQQVLIELAERLRDLVTPDDIAFTAAGILGRALGVDRVGYGLVDRPGRAVSILKDWHAHHARGQRHARTFAALPSLITDLAAGETIAVADTETDPRTCGDSALMRKWHCRAMIAVPIVEQGVLVAMMYATGSCPVRWTADTRALVQEVAERVRSATERARSDAASRESQEQFRVFAQAVPNQIWAARPDGALYWLNRQAYAYTGIAESGAAGFTAWRAMVHEDDLAAAAAAWAQARAAGTVYDARFRIRRADGVYRWFLVRAEPVRAADGSIVRWVGTNTDIDDGMQQSVELARLNETLEAQVETRTRALMVAEEALRQSQKMEAVGQLTGGIAHDFNNLLTGISGSLELLAIRIAQGRIADVDRYITAAQGAANRAAALTHRLLAFSRRQTLDPRPTDVNRLVAGMEDMVRRTVGPEVHVEVVTAGGLWPTLVDPPQLENALLNLCINARDAMPGGGRLTIETGNRRLDARAARDRGLDPGDYLSLCVSDNGTGMPPDVIAKAFDPFFTTKPLGLGTGLGLSMVYGFVRQSGGHVRIYSEIGDGTLVCLYLPRHRGAANAIDLPADVIETPRATQGDTVLVVDDEATVRMLVIEVLEELGYAALEAADGAEGLAILQSDARIDLLVTDVGLPGGMNGRQMADAARIARPDLKILFITGYAENAVVGNGHLDPGMHVMTKPFAMDALGVRIRDLIGQSDTPSP